MYRPKDWKNDWDREREYPGMLSLAEIFEAGADAILERLRVEGISSRETFVDGFAWGAKHDKQKGTVVFIPEES